MNSLRALFGPSKSEIWQQLSNQIGARFVRGDWQHADQIVAEVEGWTVTLDTVQEPIGRATLTYTRLRAPFVNHDGFRFRIFERNAVRDIEKALGMQDVEMGDSTFDAAYILQTNREKEICALLADADLRHRIAYHPSLLLEIKDDDGRFTPHFPNGVDELCLRVHGHITDLERLNALFDLFADTLHGLCHIGSAYDSDPHLDLPLTS